MKKTIEQDSLGKEKTFQQLYLLMKNGEREMALMGFDLNESYKFLGCEQADVINADTVYEILNKELKKSVGTLNDKQLNERYQVKAINTR